MSVPVSIIIPAFNQLDFCRQCITTLLDNTEPPYKLILVDNGSTDGVSEFFDQVPGATVIHAPENLGFAKGINLGLEQAEGHALLLNSDTILPKDWLTRLVEALESDALLGAVGPRSNCVSGPQQIDGLNFSHIDEINQYSADLYQRQHGQMTMVTRLVGFCLLIRDTVWNSIGGMEEAFGIGNFEDDDYCLRVLRAGYKLGMAEDCFVFHYGSRTFLGMGITDQAWTDLIARNETVFREKWSDAPEQRNDAIHVSARLLDEASKAAASGDLTEALRKCAEAQRAAPTYDRVYNDMGAVLWALEMRDEALKQFERALALNPSSIEARNNLADARAAMASGGE